MKKSIIISLWLLLALPVLACGPTYKTYNYYMFRVFKMENKMAAFNTDDYWEKYSGGKVTDFDGKELLKIAKAKKDFEMATYISHLDNYIAISNRLENTWDYPTKQELQQRTQQLNAMRSAATAYNGNRLRSRYALLLMRANMVQGRHQENKDYWEKTASKLPANNLRDRMENIYAGALCHLGKVHEGCCIFARQGDELSVKWCVNNQTNYAAIKNLYNQNVNSYVLPWMVQKFVNYSQEVIDNRYDEYFFDEESKKDYAYYDKEMKKFIAFAEEAAKNPKVKNPMLYLTANAMLHFLLDNQQAAEDAAERAGQSAGTPLMKENLRAIRFLISTHSGKKGKDYDRYVLQELQWLNQKVDSVNTLIDNARAKEEYDFNFDEHYYRCMARIVENELVPYYQAQGRKQLALTLLGLMAKKDVWNYTKEPTPYNGYVWTDEYTDYAVSLDSLTAKEMIDYTQYLASTSHNELENWLCAQLRGDYSQDYLNDVIGTKYLREGNFAVAQTYLEKVPMAYVKNQEIAPWMAHRDYNICRWMKKQRDDIVWNDYELKPTTNKKVEFCRLMQDLTHQYATADKENRKQLAYRLAGLYYQASYLGDCWWLTRYGKSWGDSICTYEQDFVEKSMQLLEESRYANDERLTQNSLYALAFIPVGECWQLGYDYDTNEYYYTFQMGTRQFLALQALRAYADTFPVDEFVSKCDVLICFRRQGF